MENKQKKEEPKHVSSKQQAIYAEMEKSSLPETAVKTFRRRPYSVGGIRNEKTI